MFTSLRVVQVGILNNNKHEQEVLNESITGKERKGNLSCIMCDNSIKRVYNPKMSKSQKDVVFMENEEQSAK